MTLIEIAQKIGIKKGTDPIDVLPEKLLLYYPVREDRRSELCSEEMIDRLQERFDFFKDYYDVVKERWAALEKDEYRKTWLDVASLYFKDGTYGDATKTPVPEPDGTLAGDLLSLFILLPSVEKAYDKYRSRGFTHEETVSLLHNIYSDMKHTSENVLFRPSLKAMYFRWLTLYCKANIFHCSGLNFEFGKFKGGYVLKNKKTGELATLSLPQMLHKSGLVLGSVGAEDEEGAVETTYTETEDAFIGHTTKGKYFELTPRVFPKTEWELLMGPTDERIGMHIPRQTNLSPESVARALEEAKEVAKRCFPEHSPKMFVCTSWIISPDLEEVLPPESKIIQFGRRYTRFPKKDAGKSVFTFVFPQSFTGPLEDLPEDTSLMRSLKKRYLAGDAIRTYVGVIEF